MKLPKGLSVDNRSVVWNPILESIFIVYQKLVDYGFMYFEEGYGCRK